MTHTVDNTQKGVPLSKIWRGKKHCGRDSSTLICSRPGKTGFIGIDQIEFARTTGLHWVALRVGMGRSYHT